MVEKMENFNIYPYLQKKSNPIIEGPQFNNDISYKWVSKSNEIHKIEDGIPIIDFVKENRMKKTEFLVNMFFKFLIYFK